MAYTLSEQGAMQQAVAASSATAPTLAAAGYFQKRIAQIIADGLQDANASRLTLEGKLRYMASTVA